MPSYDLKCEKCSHEEERLIKLADLDEKQTCPKCKSEMKRQVTCPGMVTIHDCQGKGDLFHKRVTMKNGKGFNTTDGFGSRYYYKNNPTEDPRIIKRKMESDTKK